MHAMHFLFDKHMHQAHIHNHKSSRTPGTPTSPALTPTEEETMANDRSKFNEPNRFEVIASFKSVLNTELARKIFPIMTWASYERHQAHTWALRLIKADPKTGEEAAAALTNYDYMISGAIRSYREKAHERKRYDAIIAAYHAWKSSQPIEAAA